MSLSQNAIRCGGALCVILIATLSLGACSGTQSSDVVARVGDDVVTKQTLERWTAIEAVLAYETDPKGPVPKGVVLDPPAYTNCIARLSTSASLGHGQSTATAAQLKTQCEEHHQLLQHHILDILLTTYWLRDEAREKGVKLPDNEVKKVLHEIFPKLAALHRHLSVTGELLSDEMLIIEKDLLDTKLLRLKEGEMKREGLTSEHQHEQGLIQAAIELTKKWAARTSCRAGYVVSECRQFKGKRSLFLP